MEQRYVLGVVALLMVVVLGVGFVSAFGKGFGFRQDVTDEQREEMQENMEALQNAIDDEDYATWSSLMEEQIVKMQEQITEENFDELVAKNQEMKEKQEEMQQFREEFCEEHDCPEFEDGEVGFKHPRMGMGCKATSLE